MNFKNYTLDQFNKATTTLMPILSSIREIRFPAEGPYSVGTLHGSEPILTCFVNRRPNAQIVIEVRLLDDGAEPYAIVALLQVYKQLDNFHQACEAAGNCGNKKWYGAHITTGIAMLYPEQFKHIPAAIDWLNNQPIPQVTSAFLSMP